MLLNFFGAPIYGYSEQQIAKTVNKARWLRVRFCVTAAVIFAVVSPLYFYSPDSPILRIPIWSPLLGILITLFLPWNWRAWPDKLRRSLGQTSVEITRGSVAMFGPSGFKRQFNAGEILRAEEPSLGTGLYLRTSNRYRWIVIPRKLEAYESIKQELSSAGIAIVKTSSPPNWEEFAGMLLFAAIAICSFTVHNIQVLAVNTFVSVLLSFAWFYVINANPDFLTLPRMRWARFGAFLPALFALAGLWLALHGRN